MFLAPPADPPSAKGDPFCDLSPPADVGPGDDAGPPADFGPVADLSPPADFGPVADVGPPADFGPAANVGPPADYGPIRRRPEPVGIRTGAPETVRTRFPNGLLRIEKHVVLDADYNYINHGNWREYDAGGRKLAEGRYAHGKRQGLWTRWYHATSERKPRVNLRKEDVEANELADGLDGNDFADFERPFSSVAEFKNGVINGIWSIYDARRQPIMSVQFENGRLNGRAVWYFANGRERRRLALRDGVLHGECIAWEKTGRESQSVEYINGRRMGPETLKYPDGAKRGEGLMLRAREIVDFDYDWDAGRLRVEKKGEEGKDEKTGRWTFFHKDGSKMHAGEYKRDVPVGLHAWWYPNQQKMAQGTYRAGKQHGSWIWWHDTGFKRVAGEFNAGEQIGRWIAWNENGKVDRMEPGDGRERRNVDPSRNIAPRELSPQRQQFPIQPDRPRTQARFQPVPAPPASSAPAPSPSRTASGRPSIMRLR